MIRDILRDTTSSLVAAPAEPPAGDEILAPIPNAGAAAGSGFGLVILAISVFANEAMIFPCRYQIASPTSQISSASITRPSFKCSSSASATAPNTIAQPSAKIRIDALFIAELKIIVGKSVG